MPLELEQDATLKDYVGIYSIPATMEDSIEQYRLDCIRDVDDKLKLDEKDYRLIGPVPGSDYDQLVSLYDPLLYFKDKSLEHIQPGISALIPPVPADFIPNDETLKRLAEPHLNRLMSSLSKVETACLVSLATGVAASFFDSKFDPKKITRTIAIQYLAYSTADNPVSRYLGENQDTWKHHRRHIQIPDMVEKRRADLVELFKRFKQPLRKRELECVSEEVLTGYAQDMRFYILEQNRHITFCRKCGNKMLAMNQAINTPVTDMVM